MYKIFQNRTALSKTRQENNRKQILKNHIHEVNVVTNKKNS